MCSSSGRSSLTAARSPNRGAVLLELADLVQRGLVRVLDLVVIKKDNDGSYEAFEFGDPDAGLLGEIRELETQLADLLSWKPNPRICSARTTSPPSPRRSNPGSAAGLLVYGKLWAAPFGSAVRR